MTYINHLLFHQEMQLGIFGYFCLLLALGYFKLLWDSAFNKLIKILVTVFLCSTAITQQLEWELSLLSVPSPVWGCPLHLCCASPVCCGHFPRGLGEEGSQMASQTQCSCQQGQWTPWGVPGSGLAGHCWEGRHGGTRQATTADDKFPFTPENPTHKKGFVGTLWCFFFFLTELSFYSI